MPKFMVLAHKRASPQYMRVTVGETLQEAHDAAFAWDLGQLAWAPFDEAIYKNGQRGVFILAVMKAIRANQTIDGESQVLAMERLRMWCNARGSDAPTFFAQYYPRYLVGEFDFYTKAVEKKPRVGLPPEVNNAEPIDPDRAWAAVLAMCGKGQ
jgi:hypothetical protein